MLADAAPRLFPLFADLRGRAVLVVGGGTVAARKVADLRRAGAQVRVVARALNAELQRLADDGDLDWIAGEFAPAQLDDVWLAIAATDDPALHARIAVEAGSRRVWLNVVDDVALSGWQSPAVVDRVPLQVAVSSGGAAPVLARQVRERIEALLDDRLGDLATLLHRHRARIRDYFPDLAARRRFLEGLADGTVGRLVALGDAARAEEALLAALEDADTAPRGFVSIVGAGPDDPGLLTLKAQRRLQQADVILHDSLVPDAVLALARRDALRIETGKRAGGTHTPQGAIHRLMHEHAMRGLHVVRLKGGDPFVFGRGGEEIAFLRDHGIDYEVVPGITAALACAAHAGIPLTHREHAQAVRFVTAHCRDSLDTLDWQALAQERQTVAVYMGVGALEGLRDRLIAHGRDPDTPFALVENGSRPEQRVVAGVLRDLPLAAARFTVESPALLILGEVAALATRLHWFGQPPLQLPGAGTVSTALPSAA